VLILGSVCVPEKATRELHMPNFASSSFIPHPSPSSTCLHLLPSLSTTLLRSAGDLPRAIGVDNNLGAGKQALTKLLLGAAIVETALPLGPPPPLLDQSVAGLAEVAHLVVLHALEPVAEAGADEAVDGVGEEALAVEEGAHLDSKLPQADGDTWEGMLVRMKESLKVVAGCLRARTEAGPEEDFGDHCVGAAGRVAPARCVQSVLDG
jgi:hypothetical protein